jgi:DNA-binding Lrp family transcriptional regulator
MTLDAFERALVEATQEGLPLTPRPYAALAARLGSSEDAVIEALAAMQARGVVRRIAAAPNHYALGMLANGMTVWDVDDARIDAVGPVVGALPFVTHSYRRPRALPDWPYNLFAMVHGADRDEVEAKRAEIAALLGPDARGGDILYSTRILKKTGLRLTRKDG